MAEKQKRDFGREARDTVVKSSLTGVGVTVLAVTALSPAGFGGMIGTSVASGTGADHAASVSADPYAKLPPFPTLLSRTEIDDIHGQLAATAAAMEITRAATDDRIEFVHQLAERPGALSVAPAHHFAKANVVAPAAAPQTVAAAAPQAELAPVPVTSAVASPEALPAATPIAPISFDTVPQDSHLEFAALLLGDN